MSGEYENPKWYDEDNPIAITKVNYTTSDSNMVIEFHGASSIAGLAMTKEDAVKWLEQALRFTKELDCTPKLKPCPFCGGEAEITEFVEGYKEDLSVECKSCEMVCLNYHVRDLLVRDWNLRAGDDE